MWPFIIALSLYWLERDHAVGAQPGPGNQNANCLLKVQQRQVRARSESSGNISCAILSGLNIDPFLEMGAVLML